MTVRLDEFDDQFENLANQTGRSKSDLVREALREYLKRRVQRPTPWETGKQFVGQISSGRSDLSRDHSRLLNVTSRGRSHRS